MRIALFSDIHANLPALEAMFRDMDTKKPDAVYCLGDLVGYHIWPNEVITLIQERRIPVLMGNHDERAVKLQASGLLGSAEKYYAYQLIDGPGLRHLKNLPAHIRLEYREGQDRKDILLVHGSPRRNDEYVLEDMPEEEVVAMMEEAGATVLCVAHSHIPYHRIINTENGRTYHVVNTGSVGKPKDGNAKGCYVLLTLDPVRSIATGQSVSVTFIRFAYDVKKAADAILSSPLPDELADRLLSAY